MPEFITTLDSRHDHDKWLCLSSGSIKAEIEGSEQHLRLQEHAEGCLGFV